MQGLRKVQLEVEHGLVDILSVIPNLLRLKGTSLESPSAAILAQQFQFKVYARIIRKLCCRKSATLYLLALTCLPVQ